MGRQAKEMRLSQVAYEVLGVVVMGETTLQSLAHSLKRLFQENYEARIAITSNALLELAQGDCIRWDFYKSYGNSRPERVDRKAYAELLEDLAVAQAYMREINFDEERDEVTLSVWISEAGQEVLKQSDEE